MADFILICRRPGRQRSLDADDLARVAERLAPSNIDARPTRLVEGRDLSIAVLNPSPEGVRVRDDAVCLGGIFGDPGQWWRVGSEPPDGTYVLLRHSDLCVELLTDITASRTIWYAFDKDAFLASTSQRALVALMGDLQVDERATAWLVSSGTLGPEASWDTRIHKLPGDSRLSLDRERWHVAVETQPAVYVPVARPRDAHVALLKEAILWSCSNVNLDVSQWLLPLSGGRDSRALLAFMVKSGLRPTCVTWTTRASRHRPFSDAAIAPLVARHFGVEHEFAYLDVPGDELPVALDRFVAVGEGRSDAFAGYTDGCAVWRDLFAKGVSGIIRGDEAFGDRQRAASPEVVMSSWGGAIVGDFPVAHVIRRLGLAEQERPERLLQRPGEGLEAFLDRVTEQGYISGFLSPLNDLKGRYIEVVNPLLSRRIVSAVRTLPDHLRVYGRAFARVIDGEVRHIPYARFQSTTPEVDYLEHHAILETIVGELSSRSMERVLGEEAVVRVLVAMAASAPSRPTGHERFIAAMKAVRTALPRRVAERLSPRLSGVDPLSPSLLALRATMASKMIALLEEDAALLRRPGAGRSEASQPPLGGSTRR